MSVEKKMVTEMREVEVEKVVLTLSEEQAAFITAVLYNTDSESLALVPGMYGVTTALLDTLDARLWGDGRKFTAERVTVQRVVT